MGPQPQNGTLRPGRQTAQPAAAHGLNQAFITCAQKTNAPEQPAYAAADNPATGRPEPARSRPDPGTRKGGRPTRGWNDRLSCAVEPSRTAPVREGLRDRLT